MNKNKGFTLLELIIVVTIIALLAAATFVAIDPAKRIGNAQNATRWSDTTAILNAIMTYVVDNSGTWPGNVDQDGTFQIGTGAACNDCTASSTVAAACKDIDNNLVDTYLATMPQDPSSSTGFLYGDGTGYYFMRSSSGRVQVGACTTYNSEIINVSR